MYKKQVPPKYESLIGDENTPILDNSEILDVISDHAIEILSDDSDSKYQLLLRIKSNDDSLPKGSELLKRLGNIQDEKTIQSQYDSLQARIRDYKTIPRENCLAKLQECIHKDILMQPDINVHFREHNVIGIYKALKRKYLRGTDRDETIAIGELNFIKMNPDENWATFEIRWSNCIIKYILMTQRTKITDSLESEYNYPDFNRARHSVLGREKFKEYYPEEGIEPYLDDAFLTKHLKRAIMSTLKENVQFQTKYNELYMYLSSKRDKHTYKEIIEYFEHQDHENNDVGIHSAVPIKKAHRRSSDDDVLETSLNVTSSSSSGQKYSSFDSNIKLEAKPLKEPNYENKLKTCSYQLKSYLGKLDVLCPNPKHKQQDPKRSHKIGQCTAVDIDSLKPFASKCFEKQKNITADIIKDILQAYKALRYDDYQKTFKSSGPDTKTSGPPKYNPKSKSTYGGKNIMNYTREIFHDMKPISRSRGYTISKSSTLILDIDNLRSQAQERNIDYLTYINILSNSYAEAANRLKNLYITHRKLDETTKRDEIAIRDTNVVRIVEKEITNHINKISPSSKFDDQEFLIAFEQLQSNDDVYRNKFNDIVYPNGSIAYPNDSIHVFDGLYYSSHVPTTGIIPKRKLDTVYKDDVSQSDSVSKKSDHTKTSKTSELTKEEDEKSLDTNKSSFNESIKKIMQKHYDSSSSSKKKEEEKNLKDSENKKLDDEIRKDSSSFTIGLLDSGGNPIISSKYDALPTVDVIYDDYGIIIDYRESDVEEEEKDDDERSQSSKNSEEQLEENRQVEMMIEEHEEKIKDDQEYHPSNSSATTDHA
jgi:hypothetical protein